MKLWSLLEIFIVVGVLNLNAYCQENFCGIGADVLKTHRSEGDRLQITLVISNSPAARAGLVKNQIIRAIDGVPSAALTLEDCIARIRGKSGTKVVLEIEDRQRAVTNSVDVMREPVPDDPLAHDSASWVEMPSSADRKPLSVGLNQTLRISNANGGIALIQFTGFGTTNAFYRWRFRQTTNAPIQSGRGVVFENYDKQIGASGTITLIPRGDPNDLMIKAGDCKLEWSVGSSTNSWLYYNPSMEKIEILGFRAFNAEPN